MKGSFRLFCAAAAAVVFLAGCAHPQLIDMGESSAVVAQELGEPMAKTPMPDGTERWTYSMQPFGQEVWWLFMDKTGHVVAREQGLQEKYFPLIKIGESTEADVWKLWGRCAQKYEFHLVNEHAWMYRFKDHGGFDMAVWPQHTGSTVGILDGKIEVHFFLILDGTLCTTNQLLVEYIVEVMDLLGSMIE